MADSKKISSLFGTEVPAIAKHIKNIHKSGELDKNSTVSKMEIVQKEGKRNIKRNIEFYNLDMIISVGYRVNSKRATQFRIWATQKLRNYLVRGFAIDEKRLLETKNKFNELQAAVDFLRQKSKHELLSGQEKEILNLLGDYSKTLSLLEKYDKEEVALYKQGKGDFVLDHQIATKVIDEVKKELQGKKEASDLFGTDAQNKLPGILGNNGLAALALLIAISDPKEKDKLIKIVTNLLR